MANYTTDPDLEDYIPDILDHGIPGILDGGLKTTLTANADAEATTITVAATTGLAAGDSLKVDSDANVEIVTVGSINTLTITLDAGTPLRKEHRSGVKVTQVNSSSFAGDHAKAKADIDRMIDLAWYRPQVRARTGSNIELLDDSQLFDPDLMLNASTQLKALSAFRVLGEYVCPKLSKFVTDGDEWSNRAKFYRDKFMEELERVLAIGIDYDWDESGVIENDEKAFGTSGFRIGRA